MAIWLNLYDGMPNEKALNNFEHSWAPSFCKSYVWRRNIMLSSPQCVGLTCHRVQMESEFDDLILLMFLELLEIEIKLFVFDMNHAIYP